MELRPLGRSGLRVSVLGFGCGDVGGLMVRGSAEEQRRSIARALEAGVNFFDTSDSYGKGQSEIALGRALRDLGANPIVATKVTRSDTELADNGVTIRASLEESLRRLGRDSVDLFLLHGRVGLSNGGMDTERVLGPIAEGMVAVREAGLTRLIGFNGLGDPADLHRIAQLGAWDAAHCYVNALNPSAGWDMEVPGQQNFQNLIGRCAENGAAPIGIRLLAGGALAPGGARHPLAGGGMGGRAMVPGADWERDVARGVALSSVAEQFGLENAFELSVRMVMRQPELSTLLFGFSAFAHLEDALRWVERGPLTADQVDQVLQLAASGGTTPPSPV